MKKYSVDVKFKNGQDLQFETNSNFKKLKPIEINGERCFVTEEEHILNLRHVKKIETTEL